MNDSIAKLSRNGSRQAGRALSHRHALERMAAKGVDVSTFIDAGAARGAWSSMTEKYWPGAHFHLLEAKEVWRRDLEKLTDRKNNYSFTMKAVSDTPGTIYFPSGGDAYGGAAFKEPGSRDDLIAVPATSIDYEVDEHALKSPFGIKLDTHGTEVDILDGATATLKETALLCIETYNFIGQKRFPELLLHMQSLGFRVADIAEPLFRESDAALWQVDFYFLRAEHRIFKDYGFTKP
ncbi:MAG: FkbM family methyltransferase [Pseudomonadota bacterium]